jgi:Fic family protein
MRSFRDNRLRDHEMPLSTAWLLSDIAEYRGKQGLLAAGQSAETLRALRDSATIQSVESSNRIEGVTVPPKRLRALVAGTSPPRDRSEQEIQGYRRALHQIHSDAAGLAITPDTLRLLHADCQSASGDAGQFKRLDNDIVELRPGHPPVVRFRCVMARETPAAVEELCECYRYAIEQDDVPPLIAIAALVLDFLCIHPFRDGNGRVSRLLTLLELDRHGYDVGRYVSLERLIEESREEYYENLRRSSHRWHEGAHDLTPWLNFMLAIVRRGYVELQQRMELLKAPRGAKAALVLAAVRAQPGEFRVSDLERACPGVGREWIRTLLADLKRSGEVSCQGRGRGARWRRLSNEGSNA